ncbi:MAG TPA: hypothetical protein ENJ19_03960 [Gammaproteobacteria bacterium]|nr:hypothetical protein [Gammaproteobacteria bacterium]
MKKRLPALALCAVIIAPAHAVETVPDAVTVYWEVSFGGARENHDQASLGVRFDTLDISPPPGTPAPRFRLEEPALLDFAVGGSGAAALRFSGHNVLSSAP